MRMPRCGVFQYELDCYFIINGRNMRIAIAPRVPLPLSRIHPNAGRAFSPELHRWLQAHMAPEAQQEDLRASSEHRGEHLQLYFVTRRSILHRAYGLAVASPVLGIATGRRQLDFLGVRLSKLGAPQSECVRPRYWNGGANGLLMDETFWTRYAVEGRCAFDPLHHVDDVGDRFHVDGDHRVCLWCGKEQRLARTSPRVWLASTLWSSP